MKKICLALALVSLAVCGPVADARSLGPLAATKASSAVGRADRQTRLAITRAIEAYVARTSANAGKVNVAKLDVQGAWALAEITPREQQLDDARVLLRKRQGRWKVLVLGTGLYGTGRTYGVPAALRKKWGL